jgi:hypothetical protein
MQDSYFGDSYDIVKRFFVRLLTENGFPVVFEPEHLHSMQDADAFLSFVGATPRDSQCHLPPCCFSTQTLALGAVGLDRTLRSARSPTSRSAIEPWFASINPSGGTQAHAPR